MVTTKTPPAPTFGATSEDRQAWLEQRAQGVTATEVRDAAKGTPADVRRIIQEKVTGNFRDLTGNRWVDWGHAREPLIAALVLDKFGIEPNQRVMASGVNPRYLATPDGYTVSPLGGGALVSEIKTSKHDLDPYGGEDPLMPPLDAVAYRAAARNAERQAAPHFWSTGYYDQMQFQMMVAGASRCLFAWEQHNDKWPTPDPMPVRTVWVEANPERQAFLIAVADELLAAVDAARAGTLPMDLGTIPEAIVLDVHQVLEYRNAEAIAAAAKTEAWKRVTTWLGENRAESVQYESTEAKVTWTVGRKELPTGYALDDMTATQRGAHDKRVAAVERADAAVAKAQAALKAATARRDKAADTLAEKSARWLTMATEPTTPRLTITAARTTSKDN